MTLLSVPHQPGVKPQPWNINPAFVDPEWQWAWNDPRSIIIPVWEGGGTAVRDYGHTKLVGTFSGSPTWAPSEEGQALTFDAAGSDIVTFGEAPEITSYPITIVLRIKLNDTADERCFQIGFNGAPNTYLLLSANSGRGWEYQVRDGPLGGFNGPGFSVANGGILDTTTWHTFIGMSANSTSHKCILDGVLLETDTNATSFPSDEGAMNDMGIGGEVDSAPTFSECNISGAAVFPFILNQSQIDQLTQDFHGMFRLDYSQFWGKAPAVTPPALDIYPQVSWWN